MSQPASTRLLGLLLLLLGALLPGCGKESPGPAPGPVGTIAVDELASLLANEGCAVVDANGDSTRKQMGIIPGARLLSDYESYAVSELPAAKDTKLVFYCANEQCGASHAAAEKALLAGYRDVNVFPGGILGWKRAGKPVTTMQ
jgi:rhodanese-related sulfurtransferase